MIILGFLPTIGVAELLVLLFILALITAPIFVVLWLVFNLGGRADAVADKNKAEAENARLREELARLKEVKP